MAIDFLNRGQRFAVAGALSSSANPLLTANTTANTKATSYTELNASTSFPAEWLLCSVGNAGVAGDFLIDFAIGAAASEQDIMTNVPYSSRGGTLEIKYFLVPIHIPAGTRISARCQSNAAGGAQVRCQVILLGGANIPALGGVCVTYGASTGDSGGTSIDPGGAANTKGGWVEVVSSTTREINWLVICIGGAANAVRSSFLWALDIAIGGAGVEQPVIADLQLGSHTTADDMFPGFMYFPCHIPAGSRLSAQAACNGTDATDRLFDIILLGVG